MSRDAITSTAELRAVYRTVTPRAAAKVLHRLDGHCLRFIALSPFAVMGTAGAAGADVSPRGGPPGFVKTLPDGRLALPDFPGNNRLDSFENIIETGRIALIFMIPGFIETLRVNGRASLSTDPELKALAAVDGREPISLVLVEVEDAYLHCGKALMRSALWEPEARVERAAMPSFNEMLRDHTKSDQPPDSEAAMLETYRKVLY